MILSNYLMAEIALVYYVQKSTIIYDVLAKLRYLSKLRYKIMVWKLLILIMSFGVFCLFISAPHSGGDFF